MRLRYRFPPAGSDRSLRKACALPGVACHGGMVRETTASRMARDHAPHFLVARECHGATAPGRWHATQRDTSIGQTSRVNVLSDGAQNAGIATSTAVRKRGASHPLLYRRQRIQREALCFSASSSPWRLARPPWPFTDLRVEYEAMLGPARNVEGHAVSPAHPSATRTDWEFVSRIEQHPELDPEKPACEEFVALAFRSPAGPG